MKRNIQDKNLRHDLYRMDCFSGAINSARKTERPLAWQVVSTHIGRIARGFVAWGRDVIGSFLLSTRKRSTVGTYGYFQKWRPLLDPK